MELLEENKTKDEARKMSGRRLLQEIGHCYVMIKSNLLSDYQELLDYKQKLKTLEEVAIERMD